MSEYKRVCYRFRPGGREAYQAALAAWEARRLQAEAALMAAKAAFKAECEAAKQESTRRFECDPAVVKLRSELEFAELDLATAPTPIAAIRPEREVQRLRALLEEWRRALAVAGPAWTDWRGRLIDGEISARASRQAGDKPDVRNFADQISVADFKETEDLAVEEWVATPAEIYWLGQESLRDWDASRDD